MQSLTTASEILAQLKELADGMVSIRQDVNTLKQASSLQGGNNSTTPDLGFAGRPSELGPCPPTPDDDNTEPVYLPSDRIPG